MTHLNLKNDPDHSYAGAALKASLWAAQFAHELDLPPGNLWEPNIARHIAEDLRCGYAPTVLQAWRIRLGL